ncbi:MAG: AbrB/MazE/SpoVT family DNA-binding domain-containing protein [Terracidiphilus sp.]
MKTIEQNIAKVSSKGQVVIPVAIREQLGIERGTELSFRVENGSIIVDPQNLNAELARIRSLRGITAGGPSGTEMLIEDRRRERERELREEGW